MKTNRQGQWIAGLIGLVAGGGAVAMATNGPGTAAPAERAVTEAIVREYLLAHPEIISEAIGKLQERETGKIVAANRAAIQRPFPGATAGAANGDVTVVMFTDYACGYCRASVADVDRLIATDPKVRVVWRELPILGPASETAARAALASAGEGKYLGVHRGLFAAGAPNAAKITKVVKDNGVDPARVTTTGQDAVISREIENNIALARTLGISGTPTFVIGDRMLVGAVGYDALRQAVDQARKGVRG